VGAGQGRTQRRRRGKPAKADPMLEAAAVREQVENLTDSHGQSLRHAANIKGMAATRW